MRISVLTIGAIASIITTAAFANTVITSQTYVDNQDALKVNIAQGVGTNNANVGKTLVVNSQGNLELGAPAAGNYVEDSITDGVTNKAPSENAVHDALADKQDTIEADMIDIISPKGYQATLPALVGYDDDDGLTGTKYGLVDTDAEYQVVIGAEKLSDTVPTMNFIKGELQDIDTSLYFKQDKIPKSGYANLDNTVPYSQMQNGYLNNSVKGVGVATRTAEDNLVGERLIFEESHQTAHTGTYTELEKIQIPTVGAMMAAISANAVTLPTGTANTVVMYNNSGAIGGSRAIYDGSTTYNATNDATKLVTANGVSKMKECTRWADNAEHTDANCLLWRLP